MALKKCKECGAAISSDAKQCPKCGKPQTIGKTWGCLIVTIIILLAAFTIFYCSDGGPKNKATNTKEGISESNDDLPKRAFYKSQEYVTAYLKAPASAKFPYYDSTSVKKTAGDGKGSMFEVQSYVDAQNSFGANIRTYYKCSVVRVHASKEWVMAELKTW